MPFYNWVGAEYALHTNLLRTRKGKSCGAKGNALSLSPQNKLQTQSSQKAPEKSSTALLYFCSLLCQLWCSDLLRLLRVSNSSLLLTRCRAFILHTQNSKHWAKLKEKYSRHLLLFFFFNNTHKHLQMWSHVMKHVALSWNYLQTAGISWQKRWHLLCYESCPSKTMFG